MLASSPTSKSTETKLQTVPIAIGSLQWLNGKQLVKAKETVSVYQLMHSA
jgi:hypothetical protein